MSWLKRRWGRGLHDPVHGVFPPAVGPPHQQAADEDEDRAAGRSGGQEAGALGNGRGGRLGSGAHVGDFEAAAGAGGRSGKRRMLEEEG